MAEVKKSELPRPDGLMEVDTVLDIGPGLRPFGWYAPREHLCVEPHKAYGDKLRAAGFTVWQMTASEALRWVEPGEVGAIYLLDVIEHMTREEGEEVLALAEALKPKQIVVSTPDGYLPQSGDAWELGGEYWQLHRSGWVPADFSGWRISYYVNGPGTRGFTAIKP